MAHVEAVRRLGEKGVPEGGVAVLDLGTPGLDLAALDRVAGEGEAPVVALTPSEDPPPGHGILERGAREHLPRDEDRGDVLRRAVRRARQRHRARDGDGLLASTLEAVDEGVLVVDLEGNVLRWNTRMRSMWGFSDEALSAGSNERLVREAADKLVDPDAFLEAVRGLEDDPTSFDRGLVRFSDGRVLERRSRPHRVEGEVVGRVLTFRDVTERERTEEALRESEERFRSLYENASIGLYRTRPDGEVLLANPAMVEMVGYGSFEELARVVGEGRRYPPNYDREAWKERLHEEDEIQGLEATWTRRDGEEIRVRESTRVVRGDDGEVRYYEGTVEDVTERWEAERELEHRNELLAALHDVSLRILEHLHVDDVLEEIAHRASDLLETDHGSIFLRDGDHLELRYTTADLEDHLGLELGPGEGHAGVVWERGEPVVLEGYDDWERRAPGFPEGVISTLAGVPLVTGGELRGVLSVSFRDPRGGFDGGKLEMLERFGALASVALEHARLVDEMEAEIRTRRETEEALRESEERYRTLVDAAPDAIFTVDLDGTIASVNPAFEDVTGWVPETWEGRSFEELVHPDDREEAWEKLAEIAGGTDPVEAEIRFRTRGGGTIQAHLVGSPHVVDGEIQGLIGIGRDVTERLERERRLAESERRLRRAQEMGDIGHWTWDPREDRVEWSDQLHDIWGVPREGEPLAYEDVRRSVHPDDRPGFERRVERALETGDPYAIDHRVVRPDGSVRWVQSRGEPVLEDGEVAGLRGTSQDVTEQKRSQEALAERTRRLETLVSNLPGVAYRCRNEPGWPMEYFRGEARDLTGYPSEAFEAGDVAYGDVIHPDDREQVWEEVQAALEDGDPFEIVYRIVPRDGGTRWVWERGRASEAGGDAIEGFITDITDREEAKEELRRSEARYRNLVEAAPDVIYTMDPDGTIRGLNEAFQDITGWSPGEWEGRHFSDLVVDEDVDLALDAFEDMLEGDKVEAEIRFRTRTDPVVGHIVGVPLRRDGEVDRLLGIARDVTDRRETEEELRRSEARYRRLVEGAPDPIFTLEPDGTVASLNRAWKEETGLTLEDVGDRPFDEFLHPEDRPEAVAAFRRVLGGRRAEAEFRIRTREGGTFWGHGVGVPLEEDGEVEKILAVVRNITQLKETEDRLRTVKNFNQTVLEHAPVGIAHVAEDGTITYQNRALRRLRGVEDGQDDDLRDTPILEVGPVRERGELHDRIGGLLEEGRAFAEHMGSFETVDGEEIHLAISGAPIEAGGGDVAGAILLARDVTEERELEREVERQTVQLVHSEKMAALGHLVAGIAHEINNPLSVVRSNTELLHEATEETLGKTALRRAIRDGEIDREALREEIVDDPDVRFLYERRAELQERNLESLERIADFIDSLRTFSTPDEGRRPVDLDGTLADTVELFLAQYQEEVDLRTEWGDPPPVPCDESQVGQVVMNLLLNAAQASDEGAPVTLRTGLEGGEAVVEVEDRGEGIPGDRQDEIFDPFYTTKEDDNMGLGLSISDHIVESHGGSITVESTPGEGTVFRVRLPVEEGSA